MLMIQIIIIRFIVSSLVPRNDKLRKKSQDVNYILQQECNRRNIGYINHDNINVNRYLNGSKLHLNEAATGIKTPPPLMVFVIVFM